jgi:hypothetical protein
MTVPFQRMNRGTSMHMGLYRGHTFGFSADSLSWPRFTPAAGRIRRRNRSIPRPQKDRVDCSRILTMHI